VKEGIITLRYVTLPCDHEGIVAPCDHEGIIAPCDREGIVAPYEGINNYVNTAAVKEGIITLRYVMLHYVTLRCREGINTLTPPP
jgi:hypothetical protein